MVKISPSVILAVVACASGGTLAAAARTQRLTWSELGPATQGKGKKIMMVLPSGTRIQGEVVSVEPQALIVNVTKTSNRGDIVSAIRSLKELWFHAAVLPPREEAASK
jgi:hypothetical protein